MTRPQMLIVAASLAMFRNFRGRDAKIEALLERRGLTIKEAGSS